LERGLNFHLTAMKRIQFWRRVALAGLLGTLSALGQAPKFLTAPADSIGTENEPFLLSATVEGAAPLSVQWFQGGFALPGATNLSLIFTNLVATNTGIYQLSVSNSAGGISTNITLLVLSTPARRLYTGVIGTNAGVMSVPVRFVPNGAENGVQFSLAFDTNVLSQPQFEAAVADALVTGPAVSPEGDRVGVTVRLPGAARFAAADTLVGTFRFNLAADQSPAAARLAFATNPVAPAGLTLTNSLVVATNEYPSLRRVDLVPTLNRQTGLYHQRVELVNASATEFTNQNNLNLLIFGLNSEKVSVHNAIANQRLDTDFDGDLDVELGVDCVTAAGEDCTDATAGCCLLNPDVNGDGLADPVPLITVGGLKPGERRELLLEYFSKDRVTVPQPRFSLQLGGAVTNTVSIRNQAIGFDKFTLSPDNRTVVQFLTTTTNRYFIQYVDNESDWTNSAKVRVAQPPLAGNGSWVQWIDQGPPKTAPLTNNTRFYRLLEGF
jgi:hypothetical protein